MVKIADIKNPMAILYTIHFTAFCILIGIIIIKTKLFYTETDVDTSLITYDGMTTMIPYNNLPTLYNQSIAQMNDTKEPIMSKITKPCIFDNEIPRDAQDKYWINKFCDRKIDEKILKHLLSSESDLTYYILENQKIPSHFFKAVRLEDKYGQDGYWNELYTFKINKLKQLKVIIRYKAGASLRTVFKMMPAK